MTTLQHSPGPFRAEKDPHTPGSFNIFDATGIRLAVVTSGPANFDAAGFLDEEHPTQGPANAALFAAAPKLLQHAKLFEKTILYYIGVDESAGDSEGASMKRVTLNILREDLALVDVVPSKPGELTVEQAYVDPVSILRDSVEILDVLIEDREEKINDRCEVSRDLRNRVKLALRKLDGG